MTMENQPFEDTVSLPWRWFQIQRIKSSPLDFFWPLRFTKNLKGVDPSNKATRECTLRTKQPFMGWGHDIMYDINNHVWGEVITSSLTLVGFLFSLGSILVVWKWPHLGDTVVQGGFEACSGASCDTVPAGIAWTNPCGGVPGSKRAKFHDRRQYFVFVCIHTCFLWCWDGNTCKKRTTCKQVPCKNFYVLQKEHATTQIWKNTLSQVKNI